MTTLYFIVPTQALPFFVGELGIRQREYGHVRTTLDGMRSLLKFDGPTPAAVEDYLLFHGPAQFFTHDEILVEMNKPEWNRELKPVGTVYLCARHKKIAAGLVAAAAIGSALLYWLL